MIPLCLHRGVGLIPWSPLARGMLTRPRPADAGGMGVRTMRAVNDAFSGELYDSPSDWDVVDAVAAVASRRGVGMAEVSLAWLLGRPGVAAPIVGATKPNHLEAALRALSLTLTAEERASLEAPYRPHAVRGFGVPSKMADAGKRVPAG